MRRELYRYLDCGILANGFARVHCATCGRDELVAFSCKGRGFCPSCCGRRMAETAMHLADEVLPAVPLRQWVLSFPYRVRFQLAYDAHLCAAVRRIFVRTLLGWLRERGESAAHPRGPFGRGRGGAALRERAQLESALPHPRARRGLLEREPVRAPDLPACRAAHRPGRGRAHHAPPTTHPALPHSLRPASEVRARRSRASARRAAARRALRRLGAGSRRHRRAERRPRRAPRSPP
ncbi:MAG: hypothetical protein EXS08_13495 [Planctomycetes bacterium]|nr:hypothetical protein [Planctomycetota bacterium]